MNHSEAVQQTLEKIDASHVPIITVLNKIDRLLDPESARRIVDNFPKSVAISARTGVGIGDLLERIQNGLYETLTPTLVRLPYQQGQLISLFHEFGQVERLEHGRKGVLIQGRIPGRLVAQFKPWQVRSEKEEKEPEDVQKNE